MGNRRRVAVPAFCIATAAALPPRSQEDPEYGAAMEAQRCVWRCLAGSAGADDPA